MRNKSTKKEKTKCKRLKQNIYEQSVRRLKKMNEPKSSQSKIVFKEKKINKKMSDDSSERLKRIIKDYIHEIKRYNVQCTENTAYNEAHVRRIYRKQRS